MIDQPSTPELLEAMAATLAETVVPACEGAPQHAARVVANLCRILARECADDGAATAATTEDLQRLLGSPAPLEELVVALDQLLMQGAASTTLDDAAVRSVLMANVERRLDLSKPGYRE